VLPVIKKKFHPLQINGKPQQTANQNLKAPQLPHHLLMRAAALHTAVAAVVTAGNIDYFYLNI